MPTRLPKRPEQYFIDEVLLPEWQPSGAVGYDVTQSDPSAEDFLPVATSLDGVGEVYPHLTVQRTTETAGGESGYDFMTADGPGQNRTGQLLVTARAEDTEDGYKAALMNGLGEEKASETAESPSEALSTIGELLDEIEKYK